MDFRTTTNRETYIERFRGHRLAIKVKLNDLQHNLESVEKYQKEYNLLLKILEKYKA